MTVNTAFDAYVAARAAGRGFLLWETISAELETTVAAALKLNAFDELGLMFESVEGGESLGRYSFIGINPDKVWRHEGGKTQLGDRDEDGTITWRPEAAGRAPLDSLRAFSEASRAEIAAPLPPMSAGVFGFFGYEMVQCFERSQHLNPDDLNLPDSMLVRPRTVVVFDRVRENLRRYKSYEQPAILNMSLNETLSRTVMTSVTTLLALLAIVLFGGAVLRDFALAMMWGVLIGTYSSVFVAVGMLAFFDLKRHLDEDDDPGAVKDEG